MFENMTAFTSGTKSVEDLKKENSVPAETKIEMHLFDDDSSVHGIENVTYKPDEDSEITIESTSESNTQL